MTDQILLGLYGLRGMVTAQRDVAKIGLRACRESAQDKASPAGEVWLMSKMRQYAAQARSCQRLFRAVTRIIREVENARR